ncbi:MAG: sigma-70 family RNA polymerase sigma factor, partial [Actinomycetota bacterium]|nr:sigma-70 family RNA polymerase sigma factor [Actinomycetota bacterium]
MGVRGTRALAHIRVAESDGRLARAAAGGSDAGFATLYQRHRHGLYRTTLSVTCDPDEALDALQAATLDGLRALRRDGPPEHVRGWLNAVARDASFDLVRERRPGALDEPAPAKTKVLETVLARDHVHLLMDDVRMLSHDQRTALVLRELEGLRYDELGVAMATTPAGVRQSVHQARLALGDRSAAREPACEAVRDTLEAGGGRSARGRKVRAHLEDCAPCR